MAQYMTTSEELTSIANAIRAKSGSNSSLTYPTGFINEIGNINTGNNNTYDGFGVNPVLVYTYNQSLKLSDTDWSNITLSSSRQIIVDANTLPDITINENNYSYLFFLNGYINYQYTENIYPRMVELNQFSISIRMRVPQSSNFSNYSSWNSSTFSALHVANYKRETSENTYSINGGTVNAGITINIVHPTWDTTKVSLSTPIIYAMLSSSLFPQNIADIIDTDKTTINYTLKLYQYDKDSQFCDKMCLNLIDYHNSYQL